MKSTLAFQKWQACPIKFCLILTLVLTGLACEARAQKTNSPPSALKKLSLEELMNIEVTSVTRRPEKLSETASAIQVITQEDIHRSGVSSLPEALRLAANLEVGQVNSHDWAISARGFNNTLANKLLVMIDGRTIYTPLYAGVFWDVQNVMLEDVDRIEVISGPGGTLWGANAVNGVINIITKSAKDTQGLLVTGGGGSLLKDFGAVRYGGGNGSNLFYRVYGQRFDRENTFLANGLAAKDDWSMNLGGFRFDGYPSDVNQWAVQGNFYGGEENASPLTTKVDGQNVLGRWTHKYSDESDLTIQAYFDRTWRQVPNSYSEDLKTYDLDFSHRFPLGERQTIVWGGGYRMMQDQVRNPTNFAFLPANRDMQHFSGFVQDEIAIVPDVLKFTIGTKLEHNSFSGFEVQPSARLGWNMTTNQFLWLAVSRAVRSPSRIDSDLVAPTPPAAPLLVQNPNFDSEKLIAYELGYRFRVCERLSFSAAGYYNFYEDLRSVDTNSAGVFILANHFKGETYGIELSGNYQATSWWKLRAGYNYLHKNLQPTSPLAAPSVREGNDPEHQFSLQSMIDLPAHFQFDTTARYVDKLSQATAGAAGVPDYFTFDVRLGWQHKNWELSVVGQNLAEDRHQEFGTQRIPRSVYGKIAFVW